MALTKLLDLSEKDMKRLRPFVHNNTLHVAVHPGWNLFHYRGERVLKDEHPVSDIVDHYLGLIKKNLDVINRLGHVEMALPSNCLGDFGLSASLRKGRVKSSNYLEAVVTFLSARESLRETAFLSHLRDKEKLCLVVLATEYPGSSDNVEQAKRYIDDVLGPSFITTVSVAENDGRIHDPKEQKRKPSYDADGMRKIQKLNDLYSSLGIDTVV